jgi:hypothetical protein
VRWLPLSLLMLVGVGWGFMVLFNLANTLIQTLVPDELRGRVVSIYTWAFGPMPLGHPGRLGCRTDWRPNTVFLSALFSLGFRWLWWRVPQIAGVGQANSFSTTLLNTPHL